jgi:uncharacterized protein with ATP-grasp and redox domains
LRPDLECGPCLMKWTYERSGVLANQEKRFQLIRNILEVLSLEFHPTANVGWLSNSIVDFVHEFVIDSVAYYERLKLESNKLAEDLLKSARNFIEEGRSPREKFQRACGLSAATNVAPIGAPSKGFKFQDALNIMKGKHPLPTLIGDVFKAAQGATRVLYITDNAGEIGFDSLLIAKLKEMGLKVTLVVKEEPFFEDATLKDASFFGLDKIVDHISIARGFFVKKNRTPVHRELFKKNDLIIAKGTGSYEALKDELDGKKAIFMLKVKCGPIAADTGAELGSFIVKLDQ